MSELFEARTKIMYRSIAENLNGKKWGEIDSKTRDILYSLATVWEDDLPDIIEDCIIDFSNTPLSIGGSTYKVSDDVDSEIEIVIDDNAELYVSCVDLDDFYADYDLADDIAEQALKA